jgi:hypothetical protein
MALTRLGTLEERSDLKNAFLRQIKTIRESLEALVTQLRSTEHPVVLMGPPEVGKTTVICTMGGLRRPEGDGNLNDQMALQTGGGRVTVSEVQVRNGNEYSIAVEPYLIEEVQQFASEFCNDVLRTIKKKKEEKVQDGYGIGAEVERAIRNMSGLTIKRSKSAAGPAPAQDLAQDLARAFPNKEDFLVQVLARMELPRRNKTSVMLPRDSSRAGLDWVSKTASEINYGRHPEFSLPRRVEITVPTRILGVPELDIRLIDTRGIDEPSVPRRDLQAYLDDPRSVIVLCSKFGDAPTGATLSLIERAVESGLKKALLSKSLLLVLAREREDLTLRDSSTGEWVSSAQEGREIKLEHVRTTMLHHGCQDLPVRFLNVQVDEDRDQLQTFIVNRIREIRGAQERQIDFLVAAIDRLLANQRTEEVRAVFQSATRALRNWADEHFELPSPNEQANHTLLKEMAGVRYASSLRASVNRRGNWHNFNYWHALGFGARSAAVARTFRPIEELRILVRAALRDEEFEPAHDFLRISLAEFEKSVAGFYEWVQALGESAFTAQLSADMDYWARCQGRWGGRSGYKNDLREWTEDWFSDEARHAREAFTEAEVKSRWQGILTKFIDSLSSDPLSSTSSPEGTSETIPAISPDASSKLAVGGVAQPHYNDPPFGTTNDASIATQRNPAP